MSGECLQNSETSIQIIDPEAYGLDTPLPDKEWAPAEQAAVTGQVLQGIGDMAFIYQVLLNGAVRLHLADKAEPIEEGIYTCKALLESGKPWELYNEWLAVLKNQPSVV